MGVAIMDTVSDSRRPELPYIRVADDLRRRILAGEWAVDDPLPAIASLAEHYGVATATVRKGLQALEREGLVRIIPRWGVFRAQ
jgi:DNA-binding GntR family transcriptional regulator